MMVTKCECGCKTPVTPDKRGRLRRFIAGHQLFTQRIRFHPKKSNKAEKHPSWKGGKMINSQGYVLIRKPEHPRCDRHGYVREHILVMEQHLGRYLTKSEVVHHIDHNKQNNNINNLHLYSTNRQHLIEHNQENYLITQKRVCIECNSNNTYIDKKGTARWTNYQNGFICSKCYTKLRDQNKFKCDPLKPRLKDKK